MRCAISSPPNQRRSKAREFPGRSAGVAAFGVVTISMCSPSGPKQAVKELKNRHPRANCVTKNLSWLGIQVLRDSSLRRE
jgi:hypothetical protein